MEEDPKDRGEAREDVAEPLGSLSTTSSPPPSPPPRSPARSPSSRRKAVKPSCSEDGPVEDDELDDVGADGKGTDGGDGDVHHTQ